jgi:GAF domain-containing protein
VMATAIRARAPTATALDHYTGLVARVLDVPVVCISLIDDDGWLTTSSFGLPPPNAMLVAWAFLKRTTAPGRPLVIEDARADPRVQRLPSVCDGTVAAFLGMRLVASDGCVVGTLSAMAESPRRWAARDLEFMRGVRARILSIRGGTPAARGIPEETAIGWEGVR